jgi:hypothetical protein
MTKSAILSTMKLQRIQSAVSVDLDGETVMMDIDKGSYFALTGSGGFIWEALEHPATLDEVLAQVQEEFDASGYSSVEEAVTEFVGELLNNGLVVAVD